MDPNATENTQAAPSLEHAAHANGVPSASVPLGEDELGALIRARIEDGGALLQRIQERRAKLHEEDTFLSKAEAALLAEVRARSTLIEEPTVTSEAPAPPKGPKAKKAARARAPSGAPARKTQATKTAAKTPSPEVNLEALARSAKHLAIPQRALIVLLEYAHSKGVTTDFVARALPDLKHDSVRQALYDMASKAQTIKRVGVATWTLTPKGRAVAEATVELVSKAAS